MDKSVLGKKVKCKVTGLTGIATNYCESLWGTVEVTVQPSVGTDGKYPSSTWIDSSVLEVVGEGVSGSKMKVIATVAPKAEVAEEEPKPKKKRASRAKKAVPKETVVASAAVEAPKAEAASGTVYDKKYILSLCKKKSEEHDKKFVYGILAEYGAAKMSELDPEKYEAFGKHLESGVAVAADEADEDEF